MSVVDLLLSLVGLVLNDFVERRVDFVNALVKDVEVALGDGGLVLLVLLRSDVEVARGFLAVDERLFTDIEDASFFFLTCSLIWTFIG